MAPKAAQKKRPASDAGSASKKAKITQPDKTSKAAAQKQSKPRSAPREREEETKKRKKPITQGGGEQDEDVSMDEGSFSDEDQEDRGAESNDVDMDDGDAQGAAQEKKRLSKAEKQALHAAQPHRTTLLPSHPLLHDTLLPLWETARRADLSKEERKKAITELWEAVKGRVIEVSRGHKGGRVLQTYGGKEERLGVAMELEPQWKAMMESKYSKFLMSKLIRYCPSVRPLLIPHLAPQLLNLLNHAHAVTPLSDLYELWASAKERRLLVRGFYPREVKIFDGAKQGVEVKGLEASLEDMGEGKGRERVLDAIEKTVLDVFNATQKNALGQAIFHRLVLEYVQCIYKFLDAEAASKKMHELLAAGAESFPEIVHTKDGSAVVRELIVRGNAKPLRKHVEALCKDGDAQMVLFTAFDCVDDTKLMGKAFVSDIVSLAPDLAFDKHGRRAIFYLLTPTSTRHFIHAALTSLAESAQKAKEIGTSKKDVDVRRKELLSYASEGLVKLVEEKGEEMVRDPGAGLVVQEIMLYAQGDKSAAIKTLASFLTPPYPDPAPLDPNPDPTVSHPLDLSHAIRTYKLLLSGGHFDHKTQTLSIPDSSLSPAFSRAVWDGLTSAEAGGAENVERVCKGNAPFVMVELIEGMKKRGDGDEVKKVLGKKGVKETVEKSVRKGSALLAEKIGEL
ncbi:pumilio domain-containing protein [Cryptococcus deuterogattii LA55]|nr:pumilio domain-containing protein [Cryptococcus deuterogattii LA55]KIR74075.1 pumilio domain-containing protein [Cryptococcus deuterogattii CA1014]KIR94438.1 pumilio domain-containing protein [Cryptococcus deuterogattii CBS 10090]